MAPSRVRNLGVLAGLLLVIGVMTGLVSYSVTLYRLFCQATGFGGTTQRVAADDARLSDRIVTVRFSTDVAPDLPWRFEPVRREVKVHLGEDTLVFFRAENLSDKPLVGHATYNVTPAKAGRYFDKIQCFCFDEEKLGAGEKVEMPVDFFVSPDLAKDDETGDVDTITLAYTFFPSRAPGEGKPLDRFAPPGIERGQQLFATRCAACHDLDRNKAGPLLGGVVGRRAGAVAGYHYSAALREAGIAWSAESLDKWLADPRAFLPGARMPIKVTDAAARRDIIAYLKSLAPKTGATAPAQPAPRG
ncbi:MAG TPA: cytochrome c oxidase assembly protein [Stellaceae bacterium]|nr:cytochrome c oxidase assembly protein [Stellaceae bacterium]